MMSSAKDTISDVSPRVLHLIAILTTLIASLTSDITGVELSSVSQDALYALLGYAASALGLEAFEHNRAARKLKVVEDERDARRILEKLSATELRKIKEMTKRE